MADHFAAMPTNGKPARRVPSFLLQFFNWGCATGDRAHRTLGSTVGIPKHGRYRRGDEEDGPRGKNRA